MICAACRTEYDPYANGDDTGQYCGRCAGDVQPMLPHQVRSVELVRQAARDGHKCICLTIPTGGGKTRCAVELILGAVAKHKKAILYTNRNMLASQASDTLEKFSIGHGVRGASFVEKLRLLDDVQISMIQTELHRVFRQERWALHQAGLVIVDEAHNLNSGVAIEVIDKHLQAGAFVVLLTATPVSLIPACTKLIVGATNTELRECGLLVPCVTFGPNEPDLSFIDKKKVGVDKFGKGQKEIYVQQVYGSVEKHWRLLNPDARPTVLFAPGVAESMWFTDQFIKRGIPAAHIDGEDVYLGEWEGNQRKVYKSNVEMRERVRDMSRDGKVKIVCNRFVLREGVDWGWLAHGIGATVFGGESAFVQSGGRLLRAWPGLDSVTWQDHGGAYWRYGDLNMDRTWKLQQTDKSRERDRLQRLRDKKESEPITCPRCHGMRMHGDTCPHCGHKHVKSVRVVMQSDGALKRMVGVAVKPKKTRPVSDAQKNWERERTVARCRELPACRGGPSSGCEP